MTLSDLAALGEAIGGVAVLVTLVYLAYQFRQTAAIERTAGQRELLARTRDWVELTTTHPDLVDVLRKCLADWDAATPEEKERANGWMLSAGLQAEQALYMWRERLINEASYRGFLNVVVAIAATPGGGRWWTHARVALGDDISDLVDRELATRPADAPDWTEIFPHMGSGERTGA
ncbi:MAG: hypothetical protein ACQGVC_13470 [Myxococcota bacterium]